MGTEELKKEKNRIQEEFENKIKNLKDDKEIEKLRLENERRRNELEKEEQKRRDEIKKEQDAIAQKQLAIQQEQQRIEKENKAKQEKNDRDINRLRSSNNIALFLELIERFYGDLNYLVKTLEALNENVILKKYKEFKTQSEGKIQIIRSGIYGDYEFSKDCQKKLVIILLCYEKSNNNCDDVLKKLVEKGSAKKELIFDILLDYSKEFGKDVHFKDDKIYEEFVDYSLKKRKYLETFDYRSCDIIQLKLLYDKRDTVFNSYKIDKIMKLDDYNESFELIQNIIKYEKNKQKKFIFFKKNFWDSYYIYCINNEEEKNKIPKLVGIYNLLLSYIDLGKDDSEYKEILAGKIHELILKKLEEIPVAKNQLELLFNNDPYYTSSCYERNPEVFEKIKILQLKEEQDIEYFTNLNLEKVYANKFIKYLSVIIAKIIGIEAFNTIIKIIKINQEKNREEYINLLIQRYSIFADEALTEESLINLLERVIEYNPKIKLKILEELLPRFGQKNTVYLKIFETFKSDNGIKEQIAVLSVKNLELSVLIDLIKNLKDEEQKKDYFNNLSLNIITYDDFLELESSVNLKLLKELMKKKLIPESIYLDKNKDILQTIYEKLTTFDETKSKYLDTIINEKEEIAKIYSERFELFQLIKDDEYDSESEYNKVKDKYLEVKKEIEKAYQISNLLNLYYTETLNEEIDKINNIYNEYSIIENKVCLWLNKEEEITSFKMKYEDKANLIKIIKEIKLFQIIYDKFAQGNEIVKFDKAKELLDSCKVIFDDIQKGNPDILDSWQNNFKKEKGIDKELKKLEDYYKIENNEGLDKVAKKILIFTKKNIYYSDIKCLLYCLNLFETEETDLSKILKEKKSEFENKEDIDFEKLVIINNYLEEKQIYINEGKDDSPSIKLIRLFFKKENEINFAKTKDVDSAAALLYRLNPTTDSLKFNDILEYQSCIAFVNDMIVSKLTDEKFLEKLSEKIKKDDINKILTTFKSYFINYEGIKSLDSNFDSSKDVYENIKLILNNSKFKIEFFKREFNVYDDDNKEKEIIAQDLDGLIQLKDNINLNFEDLPDDNKVNEKRKEELKEKRVKIEIFVRYVEQLQDTIKLFSKLENKGCPFLIDILIIAKKDKITFELVNTALSFDELKLKLNQFLLALFEFQSKFYKENEYFRLIYDKQLYRLFKRLTHKNKDISSYIRFFTNGESIKDDTPLFVSRFNSQSEAYKNYTDSIEENFDFISKYIENLFIINDTSLEKLYSNIKVKDNLRGLYKCSVEKYNMDLFIIKIFLKLTGTFPIAQNILLTNNETSIGEITSFMYRAIKCRFNTLFVISISDDFSILNINQMTSKMNEIINEMKSANTIKEISDLSPCILFITQKQSGSSRGIVDFQEATELPGYLKGDENKLEYNLGKGSSTDSNKTSEKEIYNAVKVYTSECCGIGKLYRIKKDIEKAGEDYHYFGIGDDITKEELFKKLKKFLKHEIKGKVHVAIHLDLFYTKNIPLMKYFLFAMLITKLYQANDNILYIPKKINIYVEIPNGPQKFLDDFPILNLFKNIHITLDKQLPLEIPDASEIKDLMWKEEEITNENKNNVLTYIEKQNYLNTINYLNSDKKEDIINYRDKIKAAANYSIKCFYSKKIREPDISLKDKTEEVKKAYIFNFFDFQEDNAIKSQYEAPLIFKTKNGYLEINISDKEVNGKELNYFLTNLKNVMSLDESIEDIKKMLGAYKITDDNYKKMILILFRIFANIPVILMGETGCGKTELIKQLMKMLNKDKDKENKKNNFIIKNMHSGVKESEIKEVIEKAKENLKNSKNDIICIFFDEINTASILSRMKEIFVNHSLNGKKIDERIRFIGACNPFRITKNNEKDEGLKLEASNEQEMAYLVNPLPNSMLNYIFYFKSLEPDDVKKYIESIIGEEFPKGENENDEKTILRNIAIEAINYSHDYVRKVNGISSVSLRDLQRFKRTYKFFNEYYKNKTEFLKERGDKIPTYINIKSKVQSFILSLFITYYIKIFKSGQDLDYLNTINDYVINLAKKFKIVEWTGDQNWAQEPFKNLIIKEEDFLIEEMEVKNEKGIGLNNSLKENIFLMFFSIYTQIPLIVVGKPGCSKSLSIQLIIRIMRGEFSNSNFLKKYPTISSTGFQGSETNTPESIEKIFKEAEKKIDPNPNEKKVISLLVFDELGLSERSPTNCLKVLHSKLEMSLDPEENKQISFIGISNWRLDAAKMNRTIFLAIPEIKLDDVNKTVEAIANSYNDEIYRKYKTKYKLLGKIYYNYKDALNKEKEKEDKEKKDEKKIKKFDEFLLNYHGGRDLYNIIKTFSSEMLKNNMPDDPNIIDRGVKKALARNLSGLEIDGENSLKNYIKGIKFDVIRTMDLIKDNIISTKDTRFLLLASEKSMFGLLIDFIKKEIETINDIPSNKKVNYVTYIGSPFKGDTMNASYQTEMIVNIENSVAEGKIIILSDLDQIYSIFYDLFNQNYISKDGKKYCRISHGANIQKLALVNENTKFIVLVDKNNLRKQKLPFLSRFEKHIITFDALLDDKDKSKSETIQNICKQLVSIKGINYNMDNILVNTNEDIINGYIYLYKNKEKNSYRDIIRDKIIPILSQDIIFTLPLSELNKEKKEIEYLKNEIDLNNKYNSLEEYLRSDKRGKENILIVYTFFKIGDPVNLTEKYMHRVTNDIKSKYQFKSLLKNFYEKEKCNLLVLKFLSEDAKNINFFISEINNYKEINKITDDNKKFIFTIHIQREFDLEKKTNKVTTVLMADEKINQLFIDNLNGAALTIKDAEKININYFISEKILDPKKLIKEEMKNFFNEHKNEKIGVCKGIDSNNFIQEFEKFIEKSEDIIKNIEKIILSQINNSEKLIDLIIKDEKSINQNTTDFITAIIEHIKVIFNQKIRICLTKTEINNFFTTIFMLNINNIGKKESTITDSDNKSNDYSVNINDIDILNNKIINDIRKDFLKMVKEDKNEITEKENINIKINYKIPGFINIYKEIKDYLEKEKLSSSYRQDESEVRRCQYEFRSRTIRKLEDDSKDFNEKLCTELKEKKLFNKVSNTKNVDKNYNEFSEIFLNDYITYYLVNLYNNIINDFTINDIPHKIILLLLDLKFEELKEEDKYKISSQTAKILWLESNSKYIKDILDLYNIISENISYDEKEKDFLFKNILSYIFKKEIKYQPKEPQLVKVNVPYYKVMITLFKCLIDKKAIGNATSKNDNYFSYFKDLERCLKDFKKLDKLLKLDIKELSVLNEFITIYNVFEHSGKVNNLDITALINNLTKSLEIIEENNEKKIDSLCQNIKTLIETIQKSLYDSSKTKEIKGDTIYYGLISKIFFNELKRENNLQYKIFILQEFLLKDEKLFIQSNQLLKLILEDFVSSNVDKFQGSLDKLSKQDLKILDNKTNSDWIKEALIYIFEQITIVYIQNLIKENDRAKSENKKNILYDLRSYLEHCIELLEKIYKDNIIGGNSKEKEKDQKKEEEDEQEIKLKSNINLKKLFALSFIRVYLKIFIDWINKDKLADNQEIEEIITIINGKENNPFRDIMQYFVYKIIYNMNQQDINKLFDEIIIDKFHLNNYSNFNLIFKEKDKQQSFTHILFVDAYNSIDPKTKKVLLEYKYEEYQTYENMYNKLNNCFQNSGDKENELNELNKLISDDTLDIFYSVFSTKISSYLSNPSKNADKIKILSDIIRKKFDDKEKLLNIFELFLDKSKYTKAKINLKTVEILQFCLRFCLNADKISDNDNHIYYPLYNEKNINSYIPGNDIKDCKIYHSYSKIKKYLDEYPSSHGVYVCTCNKNKNDKELNIIYEESNFGYPTTSKTCKYCDEPIGNDGKPKSFYERESYYRIFKNEEDLKKETKEKINGKCITLEEFYNKFLSERLKEDSKGVNISEKIHFDNTDKPIRKQSQIGYRLMNLILYSHLFTSVLFNNEEEIFTDGHRSYLDYIVGNWDKLKVLLSEKKGVNIYIFMNLVYKDLLTYLNKQKIVDSYTKLLEIEKEIENIIENKISKKTEKLKENFLTKYQIYYGFYELNKNKFREKEGQSKVSLVKQINPAMSYRDEKKYPFYNNFLYSDYADIDFYRQKLEEKDKQKYPVVDLYLNRGNVNGNLNKDFVIFNYVIKSLLNQYSGKINKEEAKKITFERTDVYKNNQNKCEKFIKIINSKNKDKKLTKESKLENFLINSTTENGLFIDLYKEYADNQNNLLNEIINKINTVNYENFECQEINVQEAQEEDLLFLDFENSSELNEIFLMNTFRETYNIVFGRQIIKYDNYNLYSVDFDTIEKILEDTLIKNSFFLNTNEIIEMKYSGEEFLNDGTFEFNTNIPKKSLEEKDKKEFIIFYEKYLENNLISCFEIHENLKNIIKYINKSNKKIQPSKSLNDIINEEYAPKINEDLKEFLKNNTDITINKLSELISFLENLYFELAMEKRTEFREKMDESTKNKIDEYYREKSGQFITKEKLSNALIKFLLIVAMNQKDNAELIDINDNLFDYLNYKFLWNNNISNDSRFKECDEYKNLGIYLKNAYDFYSYISNESKIEFEKEKGEIKEKIKIEENNKKMEEMKRKMEEEEKRLKELNEKNQDEVQVNNADDAGEDMAMDMMDYIGFG